MHPDDIIGRGKYFPEGGLGLCLRPSEPEYLGALTDLDYNLLLQCNTTTYTGIISEYNTATVFGGSLKG